MVGNGEVIAAAPAATPNVPLATVPASPWVDLGYANEDGVTLGDSPSETNVGAWQSPTPVLVLTTELARTFAFNLMQWNADVLAFVFGGGLITPAPAEGDTFAPTKTSRSTYALLMRWLDPEGNVCQFYVPRGRVTGDVGAQLARTAAGVFSVTFTSLPEATEDAWRYTSDSPGMGALTLIASASGEVTTQKASNGTSKASAA